MMNYSQIFVMQKGKILDLKLINQLEIIFTAMISPKQVKGAGRDLMGFILKSRKLNVKVDDIASLEKRTGTKIHPEVIKSKNIIYNRINKAGSTSILSKNNI